MIIALDGPSGAGKSTIARLAAKRLGFSCLDTGAMYRCVAYLALKDGVSLDDEQKLGELARTACISFEHEAGDPAPSRVLIDGLDVTSAIRTGEVDRAVARVASVPEVRRALVDQQRRIGRQGNYVVDGRDIGSTVFPDAEVKLFVTASAEERAHRRVAQNLARGVGDTDYDKVLADIIKRDEQDTHRAESPLHRADDAVLLDTSGRTVKECVRFVCNLQKEAE